MAPTRRGAGRRSALTKRFVMGLLLAALGLCTSRSHAAGESPHLLKYDAPVDATVMVSAASLVLASELIYGLKPLQCRWCDTSESGKDSLNSVDRWARAALRGADPGTAHRDSNATALVLLPATAALDMVVSSASDGAGRALPVDVLIVGEAVAVSALLNQTTKILMARQRPFVHYRTHEGRSIAPTSSSRDDNVSFYSGHTALSFALASATGTVAALRGYRLTPLVWGTLAPLAGLTGYLRIVADKHYLTDVVVGMLVGTAVGIGLPLAFHGRRGDARLNDDSNASLPTGAVSPRTSAPALSFGGGF